MRTTRHCREASPAQSLHQKHHVALQVTECELEMCTTPLFGRSLLKGPRDENATAHKRPLWHNATKQILARNAEIIQQLIQSDSFDHDLARHNAEYEARQPRRFSNTNAGAPAQDQRLSSNSVMNFIAMKPVRDDIRSFPRTRYTRHCWVLLHPTC